MALQNFDQLNNFRELSAKWFDKMEIPEKDKKKRVELSLDYCEIIIMLFLMITEQEAEKEECYRFAEERLRIIAENLIGKENIAYINDWSPKKAKEIVDLTYKKYENELEDEALEGEDKKTPEAASEKKPKVKKIDEFDIEMPESEYWTSNERALLIGINLATTVTNFQELSDAIDRGCTRKVWITEADDRVRPSHEAVHGVDLPINELFLVGNSYMLMPADTNNGAEEKEIDNCRCFLSCY